MSEQIENLEHGVESDFTDFASTGVKDAGDEGDDNFNWGEVGEPWPKDDPLFDQYCGDLYNESKDQPSEGASLSQSPCPHEEARDEWKQERLDAVEIIKTYMLALQSDSQSIMEQLQHTDKQTLQCQSMLEEMKELCIKFHKVKELITKVQSTATATEIERDILEREEATQLWQRDIKLAAIAADNECDHWKRELDFQKHLNEIKQSVTTVETERDALKREIQALKRKVEQSVTTLETERDNPKREVETLQLQPDIKLAAITAENARDILKREVEALKNEIKQSFNNEIPKNDLAILDREVEDLQTSIFRELKAKDEQLADKDDMIESLDSELKEKRMFDEMNSKIIWLLFAGVVSGAFFGAASIVAFIVLLALAAGSGHN